MPNKRHSLIIIAVPILFGVAYWIQNKIAVTPQSIAQAETIEPATNARGLAFNSSYRTHTSKTPIPDSINKKTLQDPRSHQLSTSQVFCQILQANTGLTLSGNIKIYLLNYDVDEEGLSGITAFIQSSDCPKDLFSKIRIDSYGRIRELIDCKSSSREEILLNSGIQGDIVIRPSSLETLPLAISGSGYFLTECPNGLFLQRSGDFQRQDGEVWQGGCRLLDRRGEPYIWNNENLDEYGCTSTGSCPAIVDPEPRTVTFIDRTTFKINGDSFPPIRTDIRVFNSSAEVWDDPDTGPIGPDWQKQPLFSPPADCKNIENSQSGPIFSKK